MHQGHGTEVLMSSLRLLQPHTYPYPKVQMPMSPWNRYGSQPFHVHDSLPPVVHATRVHGHGGTTLG